MHEARALESMGMLVMLTREIFDNSVPIFAATHEVRTRVMNTLPNVEVANTLSTGLIYCLSVVVHLGPGVVRMGLMQMDVKLLRNFAGHSLAGYTACMVHSRAKMSPSECRC